MRVEDKFDQLRRENRKAFIAYIPFGFPKIEYAKDIILALQEAGADIVELGVPFSDPLADGHCIQRAAEAALSEGANVKKLFDCLEEIKEKITIPLVIMTYYNPFLQFGIDKFFRCMRKSGVSGIMAVDLPIEESKEYLSKAKDYDLETIFFVTPATSLKRQEKIVKVCKGFIYYISITGITGIRKLSYQPIISHVKSLKKVTDLPVCVGFGIHTQSQVSQISKFSDGVIIGSGIVKFIEENFRLAGFLEKLKEYIRELKG